MFLIHDARDIKCTFCLTDNIAHESIRDELPEFRCKVGDDLPLLTFPHLGIGIVPPGFHDRILERRAALSLEVVIGEEAYEVSDRTSLWVVHEGETSIAEIILNTRTEYLVSEELDHDIGRIGDDHLLLIFTIGFEEIESHRTGEVRWIEVDKIISTFFWHEVKESLREVTVRIKNSDSTIRSQILSRHDGEDRRFSRTSLPDDVEVTKSVLIFDIDGLFFSTKFIRSDEESLFCDIGGSLDELEPLPSNFGLLIVFRVRKVKEGCEFFTIHDGRA